MDYKPTRYTTEEFTLSVDGVRLIVGFMVRALKRHRRLAQLTFAGTVALSLVALFFMPPLYRVETRILTHTSYIIPALATPGRAIPWQAQSATQGAVELIKSRDNLAGIIDETELVTAWEATRTRLGRSLDAVRESIFGELTPDEKRQALISVLGDRFSAHVEDDQTIVMTLEWHDPGTALRILESAQKRFLDGRRNSELSEINETVAILERSVAAAQPAVQRTADRVREVVLKTTGRSIPRLTPSEPRGQRASPDAGAAGTEALLAEKREQIERIEVSYQAGVTRAQDELNRLRSSLGPNHPDVLNATRALEHALRAPDELATLKSDEARLAMQLNRAVLGPTTSSMSVVRATVLPQNAPNPEVEQAMAEYERAESAQGELLGRLEDARIEVQTATAAFNYRYIITQPPVYPRKAVKPKKPVVVAGGVFAALFLAIFVAIAADVVSGRIVEGWQVQRFLGVPLLGEIAATGNSPKPGRKAS